MYSNFRYQLISLEHSFLRDEKTTCKYNFVLRNIYESPSFESGVMPISRLARTHLVYQFIILALLFLFIGYYELFLDKKYILFLALVPIFAYQLVILSCCSELLPVPRWMNSSDVPSGGPDPITEHQTGDLREQTRNAESQVLPEHHAESHNRKNTDKVKTASTLTSDTENRGPKPRTYKFRNWQTNCFNSDKNAPQSAPASCNVPGVAIEEKSKEFTLASETNRLPESELTKRYFFPYRQKRLERWIDSKETARPFKIRGRVSDVQESLETDPPPPSSTQETISSLKAPELSQVDSGTNKESETFKDPELTKSYTFPFRQKRIVEQWVEPIEDPEESSNTPSMPYWESLGYSVAVKQEARRRRKSVSISNLTSEQLDLMNNNNHRDFSQSMEITGEPVELFPDPKRGNLRVSVMSFGKIKEGLRNCFSRNKKVTLRTNAEKKEHECKALLFKSFSQGREQKVKAPAGAGRRSSVKARGESKESSRFYPEYIPFEEHRFEKDVRSRMLELSGT